MRLKVCCGAVVVVLLAACTPTPGPSSVVPSPSTSPSVVSSTPTQSPSPSPSLRVVEELAPIRAAVQKCWDLQDRILKDPVIQDPNLIPSVAIEEAATALALDAESYRDRKLRIEGSPTRRNLQISAPETKDGKTSSTATYCDDMSAVKAFDASGKELDRPNRTFPTTFTLTLMPSGNWLVSHYTNFAGPC